MDNVLLHMDKIFPAFLVLLFLAGRVVNWENKKAKENKS